MTKIKAATILLALSTPAFAEDAPKPPPPNDSKMEIGGFLGVHIFNDNNELGQPGLAGTVNSVKDSVIFGIRIGRQIHDLFSAEAELGLAPTTAGAADVVAIGYRLHGLVHPKRFVDNKLTPFLLLGAGGFTLASADTDLARNDSDFVWHGGVGVKYQVGKDWGVRFDARMLLPPANSGLVTVDGEFLVGIYKGFPPPPPPPPPAATPIAPPPPAPTPTDQDGDGILDTEDKCPAEAEDRDGHEDADGCPDLDNDADGVPDAADRCPMQPETKNSYQDEDGCPDEVPQQIKQFTGVIRGIDFATNSDKLTPGSSKVLDEAVKALTEFPSLKLEISGHTDNTGKPDYNRDLSKRRAESVKAYFTTKGLAADRFETVGHGPDVPIGDNATPEGRQKNRRVEFKVR